MTLLTVITERVYSPPISKAKQAHCCDCVNGDYREGKFTPDLQGKFTGVTVPTENTTLGNSSELCERKWQPILDVSLVISLSGGNSPHMFKGRLDRVNGDDRGGEIHLTSRRQGLRADCLNSGKPMLFLDDNCHCNETIVHEYI